MSEGKARGKTSRIPNLRHVEKTAFVDLYWDYHALCNLTQLNLPSHAVPLGQAIST